MITTLITSCISEQQQKDRSQSTSDEPFKVPAKEQNGQTAAGKYTPLLQVR